MVVVGMSMPPAWVENYKFHNSHFIDPGIWHSKRVVEPFFWYDAPHDPEQEPHQSAMVARAKEFGIPEALVVPVPGPRGCFGTIWMGGRGDRVELQQNRLVIQAVGLAGFHRLLELNEHTASTHPLLSKRGREILAWVAEGKSAAEIGRVLHLSDRTIEWHIEEAMKKLGASTRTHAVVLAIRDGLIHI